MRVKSDAGPFGAARAVLWPLAILTYLHTVWLAFSGYVPLYDFPGAYRGANGFLNHLPVYLDPTYAYPPSAPLLTAPLALLSQRDARVAFVGLSAFVLVPLAGLLLLRMFRVPATSVTAAGLLFGFAISETFTSTLGFGNLNTIMLLGEAVFLLALTRGSDVTAGTAFGLVCAVKPVLAPLILLPLLLRRWRVLLLGIGIPLVLSAVAYPFLARPGLFFSFALPNLLHSSVQVPANGSVVAVGEHLHAPHLLILGVRGLAVAAVGIVLWRLQRRREQRDLWVACASGTLMLGTFLSASAMEAYWFMFALPLALSVVLSDSPMRLWPAWVGVYVATSLDNWGRLDSPTLGFDIFILRPLVGYALLLATLAFWSLRSPRPEEPARPYDIQEAHDGSPDVLPQREKAAAVASS